MIAHTLRYYTFISKKSLEILNIKEETLVMIYSPIMYTASGITYEMSLSSFERNN